MTAAIETSRLCKNYGPTRAVIDLDLVVEPGQVFGFLGPERGGQVDHDPDAAGAAAADRGPGHAPWPRCRRRQCRGPPPYRLPAGRPRALPAADRPPAHRVVRPRPRVPATTRWPGGWPSRFQVVVDRPVRELSKGNRQKIGLVLAFMHRPELLVLDEPTSGLDPADAARVREPPAGDGRRGPDRLPVLARAGRGAAHRRPDRDHQGRQAGGRGHRGRVCGGPHRRRWRCASATPSTRQS